VTLGTCTDTVAPSSSCTFDLHQACTSPGGFSGTVSFNDNTAAGTETDNFSGTCSNNPGPATTLKVTGPLTAVSGTATSVTVTVFDQYGNIATNYTGTVHLTSTDGAATLPADYTFTTADNGMHTFSVTLNTLGNQTVTATDTVTSTITAPSNQINVTGSKQATATITATQGGFRKPATISVTVSSSTAPVPTGTVVLVVDGNVQSGTSAQLDGTGKATITTDLPPSGHDVKVKYLGDGTYVGTDSNELTVITPVAPRSIGR
jgi:hypothetical protein